MHSIVTVVYVHNVFVVDVLIHYTHTLTTHCHID